MELLSRRSGPLSGRVTAPSSKSVTHRSILFGMMAGGRMEIRHPLLSDDTESTLDAAVLMGADVKKGKTLVMESEMHQAADVINARNSGTTARLLSSICALMDGHSVVTGDASLRGRPMGPIMDAVRQLGGTAFSTLGNERLPAVFGGKLTKGYAAMRGDISSQFASSLAMSCPLKEGSTEVALDGGIQSADYLTLTLEMVEYFGGEARLESDRLFFSGDGSYRPRNIAVPGDYSSAAFLLASAAVTSGSVRVDNLSRSFTQADARIAEYLRAFGCAVSERPGSLTAESGGLVAADVDCTRSPDLFPVLCVVASCAAGVSTVRGSPNLRLKETDRIETTSVMLRSLGVGFRAEGETLHIRGSRDGVRGGIVDSCGDHRIAMAACVAGLSSKKGVRVKGAECHSVSYPGFVGDIRKAGGKAELK